MMELKRASKLEGPIRGSNRHLILNNRAAHVGGKVVQNTTIEALFNSITLEDCMNSNTYTLVVKVDPTSSVDQVTKGVESKLSGLPRVNVVFAKSIGPDRSEALILVHTLDDNPCAFGKRLAEWLGELTTEPPFTPGSLLWYR